MICVFQLNNVSLRTYFKNIYSVIGQLNNTQIVVK